MNRIKKTIITAGIFLAIGITGSIVTGVRMVPDLVNEVYRLQNEIMTATPKEREAFSTTEAIENIDFSSLSGGEFTVEVKASSDGVARVKVFEYLEQDISLESSYDAESKTLVMEAQRDRYHIFQQGGLTETVKRAYDTIIYSLAEQRNKEGQIVIEVPAGVNLNFNGKNYSKLVVKDKSVLKDNFSFNSYGGRIELPLFNDLKTIDISTNNYLEMDLREIINAENVNLNSNSIEIYSNGYATDYKNINKIPQVVNLSGYDVNVKSFIPIGREVNIAADNIEYQGNLEAFPGKFSLQGGRGGYAYYNVNDGNRRDLGTYFEGVFIEGKETSYGVNMVDYRYCEINNKSDLQLEKDLIGNVK